MSKDSRCTRSKSKTRTEGRIDQYLSERGDAKSQAKFAHDNMCDQHGAATLLQALDSEDESKQSQGKLSDEGTPMFHTQSNVAILFREFSTKFTESLAELSKNIQTQLDDVQKELTVTKTEHSALKSEFHVIEHSLEYTQTKVDEIKKELALVKQENAQMKETITEFKSGSTNKYLFIEKLEETLTNKILNIERYTKDFNIRLVGIEEKSGENSKKIVAQKICELNLLGEDLEESEINKLLTAQEGILEKATAILLPDYIIL